MAIELDDVAQERKRKYIEDQISLERWSRSGFASGYPILEPMPKENKFEEQE